MNPITSRSRRVNHGLGGTPTYRSWYSMIDRCTNPKSASWARYGGAGVAVCERWLDIRNFVHDMGLRPEGTTIDRIESSRGYEPGNCRWATELEQQRNRKGVKCSPELAAQVRQKRSDSQRDVAAAMGMSQSTVSRIQTGKIWR